MDQPHQPLFNRTYLKILPWVVAILIVLLTANSQKTATSSAIALAENWVYLTIEEEMEQQLRLTYPVTPAYTEKQLQQRTALASAYTQATTSQSQVSLQWKDDRVIFSFLLPEDISKLKTFDLDSLLKNLTRSANQHFPAALTRATAERYLALSDIEEQALSNLKAHLPMSTSDYIQPTTPSSLLAQRPTVLLTLKENNDDATDTLLKQLKTRYSQPKVRQTTVATTNKTTTHIDAQHRSPYHLYLIGQAINTDINSIGRTLTFHYINQAIRPVIEQSGSTYRLLLKPAFPIGYSALSITRKTPFNKMLNRNLQTYLLENFDSKQLEHIKTSLIQQYGKQLSTAQGRVEQLTTTLFYQEKLQSEDEFRDTINNISNTQVQTNIKNLFDPEHTIIVQITPP